MNFFEFALVVLIGSGIGTFIAQKLFELRINKTLFRYTKLYDEKLAVIRELYSLLNKTERALDSLMSKREPQEKEAKENYYKTTVDVITRYIHFSEENEIIFDEQLVAQIQQINDKMKGAIHAHHFAELMEADRGTVEWGKAVTNKENIYNQLIKSELPELKSILKKEFQKKYKLIAE